MEGVCDKNIPVFQPLEGTSQSVSCFLHHEPAAQAEGVA